MDLLLDWDLITSHSIELFFLYHFIIISCVQACLSDCYNSQPSFVMFCPSAGRLESKDRIYIYICASSVYMCVKDRFTTYSVYIDNRT